MRFEYADDFSHFLLRRCPRARYGLGDQSVEFSGVEAGGQIFLQNLDLNLVGGDQVGATAFGELEIGVSEIFYCLAQRREREHVVDLFVTVHGRALDRGIGGAQRSGGDAVAGFHGDNNVGTEGFVNGGHA